MRSWVQDSVVCSWVEDSIVCSWEEDSIVCIWEEDSIVCSWVEGSVICSWVEDSVVCSWVQDSVVCSWEKDDTDGNAEAADTAARPVVDTATNWASDVVGNSVLCAAAGVDDPEDGTSGETVWQGLGLGTVAWVLMAEGVWTDSVAAGAVDSEGVNTVTVGDNDTLLDGVLGQEEEEEEEERRLMRENLLPCLPSILFMLQGRQGGG